MQGSFNPAVMPCAAGIIAILYPFATIRQVTGGSLWAFCVLQERFGPVQLLHLYFNLECADQASQRLFVFLSLIMLTTASNGQQLLGLASPVRSKKFAVAWILTSLLQWCFWICLRVPALATAGSKSVLSHIQGVCCSTILKSLLQQCSWIWLRVVNQQLLSVVSSFQADNLGQLFQCHFNIRWSRKPACHQADQLKQWPAAGRSASVLSQIQGICCSMDSQILAVVDSSLDLIEGGRPSSCWALPAVCRLMIWHSCPNVNSACAGHESQCVIKLTSSSNGQQLSGLQASWVRFKKFAVARVIRSLLR